MNTTQNQNTGQESRAGSSNPQAGNGESLKQGTEQLKQGAEELSSRATEVAQDATRQGKAQVDEYRKVAAQKVDTIAESVKAAAAKLEEGDVGKWSSQISGMADSMTRFSHSLRDKSADEVLQDVNRLARENPAIFVGGAVAIGFALTRLMRATAKPRDDDKDQWRSSHSTARGGVSASGSVSDRESAYTSNTITGSSEHASSNTVQAGGGSYSSGAAGGGDRSKSL